MTDRELLELAAKAAGFKLKQGYGQPPEKCLFYCNDDGCHDWNPITDDGDALRLAVKLKIHHRQYSGKVQIRGSWCCDGYIEATNKDIEEREPVGNCPYAATRRAIVRAAAEIGRNMK